MGISTICLIFLCLEVYSESKISNDDCERLSNFHVKIGGRNECPCGYVGNECGEISFAVSQVQNSARITVDKVTLTERSPTTIISKIIIIDGQNSSESKIQRTGVFVNVVSGNLTLIHLDLILSPSISTQQSDSLIKAYESALYLEDIKFGNFIMIGEPIFADEFTVLSIISSSFYNVTSNTNNTAEDYEYGCVYGISSKSQIHIILENSTFSNLTSHGIRGYGGFVIVTTGANSECKILDSTFINCEADYYCGAVDVYSYINLISAVMNNCSFTDCKSGRDAGGAYFASHPMNVTYCNFTRCLSARDGGGLYFYDVDDEKDSDLLFCRFDGCSSLNDGNSSGGGIYYETSGIQNLDSCVFRNCTADARSGYGGAIANVRPEKAFKSFNLRNLTFEDCVVDAGEGQASHGDGGAIAVFIDQDLRDIIVNITSCSFLNSFALNDGGAVCVINASLSVLDCVFVNSRTKYGNGGAIYFDGARLSMSRVNFSKSAVGEGVSPSGRDIFQVRGDCTDCLSDIIYSEDDGTILNQFKFGLLMLLLILFALFI